jgi:hypothetical protein
VTKDRGLELLLHKLLHIAATAAVVVYYTAVAGLLLLRPCTAAARSCGGGGGSAPLAAGVTMTRPARGRQVATAFADGSHLKGAAAGSRAVASCCCGRTSISFGNATPRKSVECCCCDCRLALDWCHARGGPATPAGPIRLYYLDNDVVDVCGEENMKLYQLRRSAAGSTRCVACCCYSTLAVDHPAYCGNCVMIMPGCNLAAEPIAATARIQTKWWGVGGLRSPLPPFTQGPSTPSNMPWWPVPIFMRCFRSTVRSPQGVSLQQLFSRLGEPVVLGVEQPSLPGTISCWGLTLSHSGAAVAVAMAASLGVIVKALVFPV